MSQPVSVPHSFLWLIVVWCVHGPLVFIRLSVCDICVVSAFLAVMNDIVTNICMRVFVRTYVFISL